MDALKALAQQTSDTSTPIVVSSISFPKMWVFIGAVLAILSACLVYYVMVYSRTRPLEGGNFKDMDKVKEGFTVIPAKLSGLFKENEKALLLVNHYKEVKSDDTIEFTQLISKLLALQKDLYSSNEVVEATRYPRFSTTSDIEQVSETAARCFAKTIPQRDLDIIFDKWQKRGGDLLRNLSTLAKDNETDFKVQEKLFKELWEDVYELAEGRCIITIPDVANHRGPIPFTPVPLTEKGTYKGFSTGAF